MRLLPALKFALLWISNLKGSQGQAPHLCSGANRTSFLRSESFELQGNDDLRIPGVSLSVCAQKCSENQDQSNQTFACASFEYSAETQLCVLSHAAVRPYGPGVLLQANGPHAAFYQKICIQSDQLCEATFSFERMPQAILVGHAQEVITTNSVSQCLANCLESLVKFNGIECKSVMYNYDTMECIMNTDDQRNRPDLFSNDTQGYIVDYFENNCAGVMCFPPNVQQYVKVEHEELISEREVSLANIDLVTCQHLCTSNQNGKGESFSCKSLMYEPTSRNCHLSKERSVPIGRGELGPTQSNIDYYEKFCFSAPQTCGGTAAFIRVPQHVLVGHAAEVTKAASVTECLSQCLTATAKSEFNCRSVMYYYETMECILNHEDRKRNPELFTFDTKGLTVDYFDNNCFENPGLCEKDEVRAYVKVLGMRLPGFNSLNVTAMNNVPDCLQRCSAETRFVCRSVNYSPTSCTASYQNAKFQPLVSGLDTPADYYEARCIKADYGAACSNMLYAFQLYTNQRLDGFGIEMIQSISPESCLSLCLQQRPRCMSVNYNKHMSTCEVNAESAKSQGGIQKLVFSPGVDYYESQCSAIPTSCKFEKTDIAKRHLSIYRLGDDQNVDFGSCQQACERERRFICRSISFRTKPIGECIWSDVDSHSVSDISAISEFAEGFSFYDRVECKGFKSPSSNLPSLSSLAAVANSIPVPQLNRSADFGTARSFSGVSSQGVDVECRYDGLRIKVGFPRATSGFIFPRNKYATCGEQFQEATSVLLSIPFPRANQITQAKDCEEYPNENNRYSYTVVVQTNPYGIAGLVTAEDQMYNATCDYSEKQYFVTAHTGATIKNAETSLSPGSTDTLDLNSIVEIDLERDGVAASNVVLGENVDLKWKFAAARDAPDVDYFVRNCFAERVGGGFPKPMPLQLIVDGCPDPSIEGRIIMGPIRRAADGFVAPMRVFRFDGSKSVMIHCLIDMCVLECYPTICSIQGQNLPSMGRRKRGALDRVVANQNKPRSNVTIAGQASKKHKVINKGEIVKVFNIVDNRPAAQSPKGDNQSSQTGSSNGPPKRIKTKVLESPRKSAPPRAKTSSRVAGQSVVLAHGKICMLRPVFIGVFSFIGLLSLITIAVCALYCWHRIRLRFSAPRNPSTTTSSVKTSNLSQKGGKVQQTSRHQNASKSSKRDASTDRSLQTAAVIHRTSEYSSSDRQGIMNSVSLYTRQPLPTPDRCKKTRDPALSNSNQSNNIITLKQQLTSDWLLRNGMSTTGSCSAKEENYSERRSRCRSVSSEIVKPQPRVKSAALHDRKSQNRKSSKSRTPTLTSKATCAESASTASSEDSHSANSSSTTHSAAKLLYFSKGTNEKKPRAAATRNRRNSASPTILNEIVGSSKTPRATRGKIQTKKRPVEEAPIRRSRQDQKKASGNDPLKTLMLEIDVSQGHPRLIRTSSTSGSDSGITAKTIDAKLPDNSLNLTSFRNIEYPILACKLPELCAPSTSAIADKQTLERSNRPLYSNERAEQEIRGLDGSLDDQLSSERSYSLEALDKLRSLPVLPSASMARRSFSAQSQERSIYSFLTNEDIASPLNYNGICSAPSVQNGQHAYDVIQRKPNFQMPSANRLLSAEDARNNFYTAMKSRNRPQ